MSSLRITIASSPGSWIHPWLDALQARWFEEGHRVVRATSLGEIGDGDLCFLLGCGFLVPESSLQSHAHNLVVHESALPQGRGWSPLTWQVLDGRDEIMITLFEAAEAVDSGMIYLQDVIRFGGHELVDELRQVQGDATVDLCARFVDDYPEVIDRGVVQTGEERFYPRRRPEDSRLDPSRPLLEQFNLLRVVDNERYPAFFDHLGHRYEVQVRKVSGSDAP